MTYDSSPLPVGVLGATGYTGRELIRLLAAHPRVELLFATSESEAGTPLRRLVRNAPEMALVPSASAPLADAAVVFSCLPHGASLEWVERIRGAGSRAIDLSTDLRVIDSSTPAWGREAVYGLPELHRSRIAEAELIANPGCYPTSAILSLAPLVRRDLIGAGAVVINAASGTTGAGRTPKRELLFAEVADDYRAYAVGNVHRHLAEMRDQLSRLSPGPAPELIFIPHLLPVRRGILETIVVPLRERLDIEAIRALYREEYQDEPFIDFRDEGIPALADVVGTNLVSIAVESVSGMGAPYLTIVAAEDNLVKGAAGQALQNLNIMQGWPETEGLL